MVFGALFVEFIRLNWAPDLVHLFSRLTTVQVNTRAPGSPLVIYGTRPACSCSFAAPAGAAGLCGKARPPEGRCLLFRVSEAYSRHS